MGEGEAKGREKGGWVWVDVGWEGWEGQRTSGAVVSDSLDGTYLKVPSLARFSFAKITLGVG